MKKKYLAFTIFTTAIVLFLIIAFIPKNKINTPMPGVSQNGFAVVELFTSEGCSSCPSADATVARLLSKKTPHVYILAYHVDYWDRLGWKDPFSQAAFSLRQNQYAAAFNLGGVYTPQVVVNGSSEFVGSDEKKLTATVEKRLLREPTRHIGIDLKRTGNLVNIDYTIDEGETIILNLALVQPEATTAVKKGENGGRMLHHVNIVRLLKTLDATGKGTVALQIPEELTAIPLQLIAYTQAKKSLEILSAEQKSL